MMNDVNACYYEGKTESLVLPFLQLYDAGRVQRFHTTPDYSGGARQNLAEHSWGVAMLVRELCRLSFEICRAELLIAALTHDLSEYWTCDMPAHVKWAHSDLRHPLNAAQEQVEMAHGIRGTEKLTPTEQRLLKWADGLELYVYSRQRARSGASSYAAVATNIESHLLEMSGHLIDGIGLVFLCELKESLA